MMINEIPLLARSCDLCQSNKLEPLWSYDHVTQTRSNKWLFRVHNVICEDCGFVFTSPVLEQKTLLNYYADSFSKFSNQRLDYDINKRLKIIDRFHKIKGGTYMEVGANLKTVFHQELKSRFDKLVTIEPNTGTSDDHSEFKETSSKANFITHYFVLEHVANVIEFLETCFSQLDDEGIMVCEVPSLQKYEKYISPLILFEHVNHFTSEALKGIAEGIGFEQIFSSEVLCSRPFGFVSVFKKGVSKRTPINYYEENKALFNKGMNTKNEFDNGIKKVKSILSSDKEYNIILWAANEASTRLLNKEKINQPLTVIDSDPRKVNYFGDKYPVKQPQEAEVEITKADVLIICTELHANDIQDYIKKEYNKVFDRDMIFIADKS